LLTMVVQSSSASVGILLSLLAVGAIDYKVALPILLGSNIGTTITAILSSISANRTAKQAAAAHLIFNLLGSVLVMAFYYIIPDFGNLVEQGVGKFTGIIGGVATPERMLANTHTLFNVINTIIWIPFVGFLVTLVKKMVPGEEITIKRGLTYLDERMLETPGFALSQLKKEALRMYDLAAEMVKETEEAFREYDLELVQAVEEKEDIINELEEELVKFITRFPRHSMSETDIKTIDLYYAIIDDIESMADDAHDIVELIRYKQENDIEFSGEAQETIDNCFNKVFEMMADTRAIIQKFDKELAEKILAGEAYMDRYQIETRNGHMERLGKGICDPNAGIIYLEVLDDLEHISDQMADIVHSMLDFRGR
ncbi:MAG: Na/Pi symporter, partial [Halanaerobiales bacterium]